MDTVTVKDKRFRLSIPADELQQAIRRVAADITRDHAGRRPLFLAVLNGSFMFAADLLRLVDLPCEIAFVKLSSYAGTNTTGAVRELIGLNQDIEGRDVIVVEDIVDTGITMQHLLGQLQAKNPASIDVCTLLFKPEKLQTDVDIRYAALRIPNAFIVGYGLDYDGFGRNLPQIYTIINE